MTTYELCSKKEGTGFFMSGDHITFQFDNKHSLIRGKEIQLEWDILPITEKSTLEKMVETSYGGSNSNSYKMALKSGLIGVFMDHYLTAIKDKTSNSATLSVWTSNSYTLAIKDHCEV